MKYSTHGMVFKKRVNVFAEIEDVPEICAWLRISG